MIDIQVSESKQATVINVTGRVDSSTAGELGATLTKVIADDKLNLVLDTSHVEYMSSAGLRELVSALRKVKPKGGDLRLIQPSQRVLEVLDMAGLTTIFEIYTELAAAVDSY